MGRMYSNKNFQNKSLYIEKPYKTNIKVLPLILPQMGSFTPNFTPDSITTKRTCSNASQSITK